MELLVISEVGQNAEVYYGLNCCSLKEALRSSHAIAQNGTLLRNMSLNIHLAKSKLIVEGFGVLILCDYCPCLKRALTQRGQSNMMIEVSGNGSADHGPSKTPSVTYRRKCWRGRLLQHGPVDGLTFAFLTPELRAEKNQLPVLVCLRFFKTAAPGN